MQVTGCTDLLENAMPANWYFTCRSTPGYVKDSNLNIVCVVQEANSINKSLSALGDVISALALEQAHVPYRNNKLTQLMQDSLGGNAKTLMFLNISPSECNLDETLTSLM